MTFCATQLMAIQPIPTIVHGDNHDNGNVTKPGQGWAHVKRAVSQGTADFLGLSSVCDPVQDFSMRRLRLTSRRCGQLKDSALKYMAQKSMGQDLVLNPAPDSVDYGEVGGQRTTSRRPRPFSTIEPSHLQVLRGQDIAPPQNKLLAARLTRRQSVAELVWNRLRRSGTAPETGTNRSFAPRSGFLEPVPTPEDDVFFDVAPHPAPPQKRAGAPPVSVASKRMERALLDRVLERLTQRRKRLIGQGVVLELLLDEPGYADSLWSDRATLERIGALRDYRPFFTYWITTVQIMVLICAMLIYGTGPLGAGLRQQERILLKPSLSLERAGFLEPENFWFGPNAFSLIHLGAKYGPCMRPDPDLARDLEAQREAERRTACCVRNDGGGCIQTVREECQDDLFFTWLNGSVCAQDPAWCSNPRSTTLRPWPSDKTDWPICKSVFSTSSTSGPPHMTCDLIGRPCCIGIRGACIVTTQEYCSFVRGHFHPEAALCSQIRCLADVCGMLPFAKPTRPDQIYRLWCSVFLHAGLVHLAISSVFQLVVMRDLEKLAGPVRIGIIYFGSGMGGNLASAVFLPDRADVGPAGAQFGLLACVLVELIQNWQILKAPTIALGKLIGLYTLLLLLGLLPWVDNYAHVFGFFFGLCLSFALLPYLTFGHFDRRRKQITLAVSLATVLALGSILLALFYRHPTLAHRCSFCKYFDCIPLDSTFCENYEIVINK